MKFARPLWNGTLPARIAGLGIVLAATCGAFVAWPAYIAQQTNAAQLGSLPTPAPVLRDYLQRDALVTFWEGAVREHHTNDMFSPRQLAGQYLQRYRETGDIGDVVRAQRMAEQSLAIVPRNVAALSEMAAIMLTLHRFDAALRYVDQLVPYDPHGAEFLSQRASLLMEMGHYPEAAAALRAIRPSEQTSAAALTVRSRYDELTGKLSEARRLLANVMADADSHGEESAQARAWYHFRAGELAFNAGDVDGAIRAECNALELFPTYNLALKDLAKFYLAAHADRDALDAAAAGARITPFPETLGYEADAQSALGDAAGAAATRDVIFAIERIGNAYRVNDRLLAMYYADHHVRLDDALSIARREISVRGNEIYAQDTLAWAAAMDGHWDEARRASGRALRYDTQDPMLQYHAGVIAAHFGDWAQARRRFARALALNPHFHPIYADDARRALDRVSSPARNSLVMIP